MILYNKEIFKRCFCYRPRYWYKNVANIPWYFRAIHYLIKNGYDKSATWDMYMWFIDNARKIMTVYRDNRHGTPIVIEDYKTNDKESDERNEKKWNEIVDRMIFLLGEMDENTCQKKNPYDDDSHRIYDEFSEKYGMFGEKLNPPEEKDKKFITMHFPSELPEYHDTMEKWYAAEREIEEYRSKCKDDFFELFSKHFYALWD